MGNAAPYNEVNYGSFVESSSQVPGEELKGEPNCTPAIRNPNIPPGGKLTENGDFKSLKLSFLKLCEEYGDEDYLGTRAVLPDGQLGEYEWATYNQIKEKALKFSRFLQEKNLCPRSFIEKDISGCKTDREFGFLGIFAKNREEWVTTDLACIFNDITSVPLYDTLGTGAIEFIINQTEIKTLCCTADKIKTLNRLKRNGKIDTVETLIVFDEWDRKKTENSPLQILSFHDCIDQSKDEVVLNDPELNSILCLCYTSGTTGVPKGAMISQMNMTCLIASLPNTGITLQDNDIHISYLPLAHTFERCIISASYMLRFSVGFYNGNILKLKEDLFALRPTLFASVPRFYNKLYTGIKQRLAQSG